MQAIPPPPLYPDSAFQTYKGIKPTPKKFKCPHTGCDRSFAKSDHLRTHVRTHTGERPFRCTHDGCHKEFSDLANLKRHMRVHTGERPFTCPEVGCGKQFSVSSNLKQHMRVHTGERPYSCPVCGKAFGHVSSRRKHMNIHEGTAFKTLVDKRSAVDNFRKMSTQSAMSVARWQHHMLRPEPLTPGTAHLIPHPRIMLRRPSSRGSESSYESTSPVSYGPHIPLLSPPGTTHSSVTMATHHSPGTTTTTTAAAAAGSLFQTRSPGSGDPLLVRVPRLLPTDYPAVQRTAPNSSTRLLKKEVSRPKPCYTAEPAPKENVQNTANKTSKFHDLTTRTTVPTKQQQSRDKHHTSEVELKLEQLQRDKARVAGQIIVARYAKFSNYVEMGRYITVMMDTSYKMASILMYLCHQQSTRSVPRQVPVRHVT